MTDATGNVDTASRRSGLVAAFDRVEGALGAVERTVATAALALVLVAITANVVVRSLELALPNFGEVAIVAMSPLTFVGAALCSRLHRHITIDIVDVIGSALVQRVIHFVAATSMAVFSGYLTWLSFDFFSYAVSSGERLIDLGTPVSLPTGFFVAGSALMLIHAVLDMVRLALGLPRSDTPQ